MRILAMADLHGRSENLFPLQGMDFDLITFCGDLHNLGHIDQARPVAEALAGLGPPVLIVPGNMDSKEIVPDLWKSVGLRMIHRSSYRQGDCGFIGFGGMVIPDPIRLKNPNRHFHTNDDIYPAFRINAPIRSIFRNRALIVE
jgi:Icc-related predicted phosphoesterase